MEKKLFWIITTPGCVLTLFFGVALLIQLSQLGSGNLAQYLSYNHWLHPKLTLVGVLLAYHGYLYKLLSDFRQQRNQHTERFYRLINEIPSVLLVVIVILAVVKPF